MESMIVVERVTRDTYRQDYLALKNMETNELIPLFDVEAHMNFIRAATPEEIKEHNVWL